jgi:putative serine protease PepD
MQMTVGQNLNFAMSCVDVAEAVAKAPSGYKPIAADLIKSKPITRERTMASDETETERGKKLLARIPEIYVVNATNTKTLVLDPTGQIWDKVIAKSTAAVEKAKIRLSFIEPSEDAAIMIVTLELKNATKASAGTGAQELLVTVEMICKDDDAKNDEPPICRIFKRQENLGTIKLSNLQNGIYPPTVEKNLTHIFTVFRGAINQARHIKDTNSSK